MDDMSERIKFAEDNVIAILLVDQDTVVRCSLEPQHFENMLYQKVWRSAQQAYRDGLPYTSYDWFKDGITLELSTYLDGLYISHTWLDTYAAAVRDGYERRQAMATAFRIQELAADPDTPLEEARQLAAELAKKNGTTEGTATAWEEVPDAFERDLEHYREQAAREEVPDYPWHSWNEFLGLPEVGMMMFLAAPESTGKTIYLEMIAEHWAKRGLRVGFFHLELNPRVTRRRRYARHTGIPEATLRSGSLTPQQQERIEEANRMFATWPGGVDYIHAPGWNMGRIVRVAELNQFDAIVVDYLQKLVPSPEQHKSSKGDILRWYPQALDELKNYCEEKEVYSFVASQITNEGKKAGEPTMADLRWWKELSEKANVGIIAWRDVVEEGERFMGEMVTQPGAKSMYVQAKCEKNTMGKTGRLPTQQIEGARFRILDSKGG